MSTHMTALDDPRRLNALTKSSPGSYRGMLQGRTAVEKTIRPASDNVNADRICMDQPESVRADRNTPWQGDIMIRPSDKPVARRLKAARQAAGFRSAAAFARRFEQTHGVQESTYRSHENGSRDLSAPVAALYAMLLKVDVRWLLYGEGDMSNRTGESPVYRIPVLTWTQVKRMDPKKIEQLGAPETITITHQHANLFALSVRDETMNRIAPEGARIIVDTTETQPIDGYFYVVEIHGGREVVYRRYRDRDGPVRLEAYCTDPVDTIYPDADMRVIGAVIEVRISTKPASRV